MQIIRKYKTQILVTIFALAVFVLQACVQFETIETEVADASPTVSEVPSRTPRPKEPTALPVATRTAISNTPTASPVPTQVSKVVFTVSGGNLNIRRGPDLSYNYLDVLYDGGVVNAIGRDRLGDWLQIELPSNPGAMGWVITETKYSSVEGEIRSLPIVEVEDALPAFIRNCTKHRILVQPANVELLDKYNEELDNIGHFDVHTYQIYDLDVAGSPRLDDVSLSEGKTVDIIYDGNGDKSKCE